MEPPSPAPASDDPPSEEDREGRPYSLVLLAEELATVHEVDRCFDVARSSGIPLPPVLKAVFLVMPDGTLDKVRLLDNRYTATPLERCIQRALGSFRLSAGPPNPDRQVYPFRP